MSQRETEFSETRRILAEKDAQGAYDNGDSFIYRYEKDDEFLLLLCELFESDWHKNHENMARAFQCISNPITAKSLFKVAFSDFDYYAWNEYYPMQRKCTWALADIGTPEARAYLEEIAQQANEMVSGFARKRLDNWDSELHRKG